MDKTYTVTFVDTHHNRKFTYDHIQTIRCLPFQIRLMGHDPTTNEHYFVDINENEYDYFKVIKE